MNCKLSSGCTKLTLAIPGYYLDYLVLKIEQFSSSSQDSNAYRSRRPDEEFGPSTGRTAASAQGLGPKGEDESR